jgi:amino acid permease
VFFALVLFLQMAIQGCTLTVSLCIALMNPGGAEKIYALVGASGVCIVCYVLPVWFHLRLMHVRRTAAKNQVGLGVRHTHVSRASCSVWLCALHRASPGLFVKPDKCVCLLVNLPPPY